MESPLRTVGQTDLRVSPIGLGVMQFATGKDPLQGMLPASYSEEMDEIIHAALAGGINWFDIAQLYNPGRSERNLAKILQEQNITDDNVLIATKWSPFLRTARNITRTIEIRLSNFHPYQIDLFQIQDPRMFFSQEKDLNAMADLAEAGKIRYIGVSNFNPEQMQQAHAILKARGLVLASNQVQYNLLHRDVETNGILDTARDLGISIIAWTPLAAGLLTGKMHQQPEILARIPPVRRRRVERQLKNSLPVIKVLDEIAEKYRSEPAQIALSWLIHSQGNLVLAVPVASRIEHVQESIGAMNIQLTDGEIAKLDEVTRQSKDLS
jgi:aryl-alcohol dehydrogenase-like predicted oxidoreductase